MAEIRSGPSLSPGYIIKYLIRLVSTNRILLQTKHLLTVGSAQITEGAATTKINREGDFVFSLFNELQKWEYGPSSMKVVISISNLPHPSSLP